MTLIDRFERLELETLQHADHIRLACAYLDGHDEARTLELLLIGLERFATFKGVPRKFHYTMTRAWLELVVDARRRWPEAATADDLMAACPLLADPAALERFYSKETLLAETARTGWVPPDLRAISATL